MKSLFVKHTLPLVLMAIAASTPAFADNLPEVADNHPLVAVPQKPLIAPEMQKKLNADLIYKAYFGSAEDVLHLLDQGAEVNATNESGVPALALAAERKDADGLQVMKALLASGADINQQDSNGQTALFHAARYNNKAAVTLLLDQGIDYYKLDKRGDVARNIAYYEGYDDLFAYMDQYVNDKREEVMKAYREHNKEVVERKLAAREKKKQELEHLKAEYAKQNAANLAAAEKLRESFKGDDFAKSVRSLSYETCALQYWAFVQGRKLSSTFAPDEVLAKISAHQENVKQVIEALVETYHADQKFITNITDPTTHALVDRLEKMGSNITLKSNGVGELADMEQRCKAIAENWKIKPVE